MKPFLKALLDNPRSIVHARYNDGFEIPGRDLEPFYLAAAQQRFNQLQSRVPTLQRLAAEQGIDNIGSLGDLVRLLFPHTVYKSYPLSYLEKNSFTKLTRWLNGLTSIDLKGVDASGCQSIEEWIELLDNTTDLRLLHSSGTTGKLSFIPRTLEEVQTSGLVLRNVIRDWFGDNAGTDLMKTPLPLIQPSYKSGYQTMLRTGETQADLFGITEDNRLYLYDDRMDADLCSLAGRIRAAEAKGELGALELSPGLIAKREQFIAREENKKDAVRKFFQQAIERFGGQDVFLCVTWVMLFEAMSEAKEHGVANMFGKGSVLVTGGGDKGYVLPDNWKETIYEGLGFDRAYELYGMSELMSANPQCEHGNYHISPAVIPFVLDPISGEALPRVGEQTGRFAFLDLLPDTFWGGFISGDEVTLSGFDNDCPCGRKGPYLLPEIRRYSAREGGDDKINCAGAPEAHDKALEYLVNASR